MKLEINLKGQSRELDIHEDESVFHALKRQGLELNTSCGGFHTCALCVVKVCEGSDEAISEETLAEQQLLGNLFHLTRERLACQLKARGDIAIDVTGHKKIETKWGESLDEHSQASKTVQKVLLRKSKTTHLEGDAKNLENVSQSSKKPKKVRKGGLKRPKAFKTHSS